MIVRFVIASGKRERLELKVTSQLKGKRLEDEGFTFGLWLLEECLKSFSEGAS